MIKKKEVFSGKTGTGASTVVHRNQLHMRGSQPIMAKLVLAYGTTITVKLQGSRDGGITWVELATGTWTEGTPKYLHAAVEPPRYHQYRLNVTANTDCTVTKGYIGVGMVED